MKIGLQKHNSFFPAWRGTNGSASAADFALSVGSFYFAHFNAVYFFHSIFYLDFISLFIYLKGIRPSCVRKVPPLLCNQRPNYYIIVVHTNTR